MIRVGQTRNLLRASSSLLEMWTRSAHHHPGQRRQSAALTGLTKVRTRSHVRTIRNSLQTERHPQKKVGCQAHPLRHLPPNAHHTISVPFTAVSPSGRTHCHFCAAARSIPTISEVICFPTTPKIAPRKGSLNTLEAAVDFYDPTMTITAFSASHVFPQISASLMTVENCPVGLSFVAGDYQDEFLLNAVREMVG